MGDAAGHYFDAVPSAPSSPGQVRLDLPDRSLTLATDRGVFSGDRVDPGTKYLLLEAPAPPARGTFVDLGCGYGPIACTLAGAGAGGHRLGGRRQRPGTRAVRRQRSCARTGQRARRRPRVRPGRAGGRPHLVQPADPHGKAGPSRPAPRLARPTHADRPGPARGPEAPRRRLADPLARRAGLGHDPPELARRATASSRSPEREAARRHRHEAPPPRVAPPHRGPPRPRARRRAGPLQRGRDHPHGRRPAGGRRVAGRPDAGAHRHQGRPRRRWAPTATSPSTASATQQPPSTRPRPPGIAWWASSWPTVPCPSTSWRSARRPA